MKNLTGLHITIITVAFMLLLGALMLMGKDSAAFVAVGGIILAGMGFQVSQGGQIKENTNGNITRLMDDVRNLTAMLAASQPTPEVLEMLKQMAAKPDPLPVVEGEVVDPAVTSPLRL